ncbi:STAS domain-containing protein [Noviherbaspirillum galbum]|uniref:STAS domain-containing protein n=1 Tax=Noviherbaspirillum galbum TaxID=2709383 RepID=UPI002E2D3EBF|nr:STAS domain-containing protein [Noviherbaspirillum galbum]
MLALEGELTIFRAEELKASLLGKLESCDELDVDLARVTDIDTSGVQVLILAKRTSLLDGKVLRLHGHSQAVINVFELLDIAQLFSDPIVMSSP